MSTGVIVSRLPGRIHIVALRDVGYPAALRTIADPPQTLYMQGAMRLEDATAVAVVGARRASPYGVAVAEQLGRELARCGVTVVSGLARGVDAAAHRGALAGGGRTIAVLGCGVDVVYPPEHRRLMAQIVKSGAVVSELTPGTPPLQHHFPRRNRLISGLTLGVVIVEGRDRSGATVTADCALQQGREVFAVPGSIFAGTSRLPHRLIQQGAKLTTSIEDILEELHLPDNAPRAQRVRAPVLEGSEAAVYARLSFEPEHIDALSRHCRLPAAEISRALVMLELRGLVRVLPGQRFVRAAVEAASV